jgi:putative NADH-flavin reductase
MQVTVLGANGKVGRLVVRGLLDEGHSVVAFVHTRSDFADHDRLTVVSGDIHESNDVSKAIAGCDGVISALGSWHTREKNILSSAMERLIPAMRAAHITRIVSLTGAGAFVGEERYTLFEQASHALINAFAPKILRDSEAHIALLQESNLDWTVVRSPVMTESGTEAYALRRSAPLPWQTIHRQAVATCLVQLVQNGEYAEQAPFIVRP